LGTNRKTTPRRGTTLGDSDADRWLRCETCGFYEFRPDEELAALWREHCDDIVEEHVADLPGTRPQRWWEFDSKEPRKRLSGIGTPDFEVLNYKPSFSFGIPLSWIDQSDCDYYNRAGLFKHIAPNQNSTGTFTGVAIDPLDPPVYESQAAYLDKHGLFLPGEKKRLKKPDFEPETLEYV
jgi:hypothetical protein